MPKISKRLASLAGKIEARAYAPLEAIALVKDNANAKFDETMEAHVRLGIDPKYTDQQLRTTVALPNGTGQTVRIAVVTRGEKVAEAKAAGADIVGADDLAEAIQNGEPAFDRLIATPDMMAIVGRLGKVLGPRNLMPNPKVGTVTVDVEKAVKSAKSGEVQFKVEKSGVVQAGLGKVSFDKQKISENITAFIESVNKAKPAGAKGSYLKRISVSSTMGPSVTLDCSQFAS